MLVFLLKFSACLFILLFFYKLFLEKEDFHVIKRFYLLGSIVASIIIPFITFTTYIDPVSHTIQPLENVFVTTEKQLNILPIIVSIIYGIGFIIFSIKFFKNLLQIFFRIKHNTKVKTEEYTNVLLKESIVPHTFLNFIFFNKNKFKKQLIPQEVILHEHTHAKQKHSIDILFIEFIQVIFWFHPLLYILNKTIKLNHEFLADQAVLKSGTTLSNYQKILLAFSSNATHSPLANAINYSFIKKRFTVMKTQTSKKSIWLKCLLILPLISLLLFSFSTKVEIEKENTLIETRMIQEGATKKQVAEYNKLAKKYNAQKGNRIIIKKSEVDRLTFLYNLMSDTQKSSAEPFPNFPPPPAPKMIKRVKSTDSNIPPPPPPPKVIIGVNDKNSNIPPPPPKVKKLKKIEKELKVKEKKLKKKEKELKNKEKNKGDYDLKKEEHKLKREAFNVRRTAFAEKIKVERNKLRTLEKNKRIFERKNENLEKKQLRIEERKLEIDKRRTEVKKRKIENKNNNQSVEQI